MSEEKVNTEEKEEKKEKPIPFMEEVPFFKDQEYIVLSNKGIDPESIDDYIAHDGYIGAAKAVLEMTDVEIIAEMKKSGLRGR
ncbi:MAG: NADH-quinone oxidoreductase subunit F, partial [Deltaproteobacteria bacterium]|nr:NADH-quinone oxidoreductase subunit F [Deltaproteobacteria bacterium]